MDFKVKRALALLAEGKLVQVVVLFRGREVSHPELGAKLLAKVAELVGEAAKVSGASLQGRRLQVLLTPTTKKGTD